MLSCSKKYVLFDRTQMRANKCYCTNVVSPNITYGHTLSPWILFPTPWGLSRTRLLCKLHRQKNTLQTVAVSFWCATERLWCERDMLRKHVPSQKSSDPSPVFQITHILTKKPCICPFSKALIVVQITLFLGKICVICQTRGENLNTYISDKAK